MSAGRGKTRKRRDNTLAEWQAPRHRVRARQWRHGDQFVGIGSVRARVPFVHGAINAGTEGRTGRWLSRRSFRTVDGRSATATRRGDPAARSATPRPRHATTCRTSATPGGQKRGVAPELGRITLRKWAEQYMTTVVHLRPTTVWLYERELNHILARFGSRQFHQLKPLDIQAWLAELLAGGMAPSSVHRKYRLLRRLLQVAVDKGVIARSPCAGVQPPRVETEEPGSSRPARSSRWPSRSIRGSGRWSSRRSRRACAGARWSGCAARVWICFDEASQ